MSVSEYDQLVAVTFECNRWMNLAIHALHDLRICGVPIENIAGVDKEVLVRVDSYDRDMTTFS